MKFYILAASVFLSTCSFSFAEPAVNPEIIEAISTSNEVVLGESPAVSVGNVYQATSECTLESCSSEVTQSPAALARIP